MPLHYSASFRKWKNFYPEKGGSNPVGDYDFQTPVFFFSKIFEVVNGGNGNKCH